LRNVMFVTLILQLIGTFQVFTEPFLLTNGGPADSTVTVLLLIYRYAFGAGGGGDYGAATALSLLLAAFLAGFSALYFRLTRPWASS
jgi:multiple sugar transport system permease protein